MICVICVICGSDLTPVRRRLSFLSSSPAQLRVVAFELVEVSPPSEQQVLLSVRV